MDLSFLPIYNLETSPGYILTFTFSEFLALSCHDFFLWLGLNASRGHDTNWKSLGQVAVRQFGERMHQHLLPQSHVSAGRMGEALAFGTGARIL